LRQKLSPKDRPTSQSSEDSRILPQHH